MRERSTQVFAAIVVVVAMGVLGAVVLASGSTAATQDSAFDVSITVDDAVDAGGDLDVTVTVQNRGPGAGTQEVTLTDGDGTVLDATTVSLADGESTDVELAWSDVPGDQRTITPTVKSETDVDAAVVTVRWAEFSITDFEPASTSIPEGGSFGVSAMIRNVGTAEGEQDVTLTVAGTEYAVKENVAIDGESFATVRFEAVEPDLEPGTYSYTVATDDDSVSGSLTVRQDARFVVAAIDGSYEDGAAGQGTAQVEAVVENEGDLTGTQPVTIAVDGEVVDERLLTLDGGESTALTFTHDPESVPINVTVATAAPDAASVRVGGANIEYGPHIRGVTPAAVTLDDTITITYTASGENLAEARLVVEGPDGATVFEQAVPDATGGEFTLSQSDLSPYREGAYNVSLEVADEFGRTDSHTLTGAFSATADVEDGPTIHRVAPELVQLDNTIRINYTAAGTNFGSVHLQLTGPDGDIALDQTVPQGVDRQHRISPETIEGLEEGPYDVTLEMRDVFGSSEATTSEAAFEAAPVYTPDDGNFGEVTYTGVAGDFVQVDVSLDGVDEAFVLVGDGSPDSAFDLGGQFDVLHVSGSASFLINTRLVGTDRPSEEVYVGTDGAVTSYAHDLGAESPPTGPFADLRFETRDYEVMATNLSAFRSSLGITGQRRPLQPGTFSLALGGGDSITVREDNVPDPRFPLDRATIDLSAPEVGNVTTYRLPPANADEQSFSLEGESQELTASDVGSLVDAGIETGNLTVGDRLLVEVEASGMWGAMVDSLGGPAALSADGESWQLTPAEFRSFLDRPEGIDLTLEHTNSGRNEAVTEIDLLNATREDVSIFLAPPVPDGGSDTGMGRFYVLVDTRPPAPFETQPADNDTFRLNFSYEGIAGERYTYPPVDRGEQPAPFAPVREPEGEQFPYFTDDETTVERATTVTFAERFFEYNRTTVDGRPIVTTDPDATVEGVTNLAPGSDLPIRLVLDVQDEPTTVEIRDVTIEPDGSFSVGADLSMLDPDDQVRIQFWAYQELIDERRLALFEEPDEFTTFEVADLQTQSLVREDAGPVVNVTAVIENTGSLTGEATVELLFDGEVIGEQAVEVERGGTAAVNFPAATDDVEPGQYTVEVRTKDDLAGELVTVEEPASTFEVEAFSLPSSAEPGAANVSATVLNTGTIRGAEPVELLVDGEVVAERNVSLLVDEEATTVFEDAIADLDPGEYVLTVRTPDDEQSRPLVIEASDGGENGNDGTDGGEPSSDSSGSGDGSDGSPGGAGGLIGIGVGSRALVGGTAVVGAVYVLGYYV
jgi:hypothetical protein